MENFWDFNVWSTISIVAVLLLSLLAASMLRKAIPFLKNSLIPTSVLGGGILVAVAGVYKLITHEGMFETAFFGNNGTAMLELITYHCLALGFIASAFKPSKGKLTKKRTAEIFNTGVTTVSTYLLQGIFGLGISIVAALLVSGFFNAAGILLPFGYGQGTGQAMNYGNIFETDYGFTGGKSFGLTIAALGFLSASVGGVIHLNILKKRGKIKVEEAAAQTPDPAQTGDKSMPMKESIDRLTVQIALIFTAYLLAYLLMLGLGALLPGMKSVIFGFNFLLGVLTATLVKLFMNFLRKKNVLKKDYTDAFLMTRASNFFFDLMIVAGIAAIRFSVLERYWGIILIMGAVGLVITYIYNRIVAKKLFPDYPEEQFLAMYGMLTGTASTGVILLRELDGNFRTPAADNLVYQNFPAIVFGFPMMLLATLAPKKPVLTLLILVGFFAVMNVILFRSVIFRRKQQTEQAAEQPKEE
jgi:ESS family glutamate:Na+ symporter